MTFRYWNKRVIVFLVVFAMVFGYFPSWVNPEGTHVHAAVGFAGGDGTSQDPYQIATADQLNEVRNYLDSHFVLINDIDLIAYDSNNSWQPIGFETTTEFSGHFNGNNFKISNLYVDNKDADENGGLFWSAGNSSSIRNLVLENVDVKGGDSVGALVGNYYGDGVIENVTVTGIVSGSGNWIGGVIGYIDGFATITNVNFDGIVKGSGSVGGIIGYSYLATITNVNFNGIVEGEGVVGGLVGFNFFSSISNSFSRATVTCIVDAGGLVGRNESGIINFSYATGNVTGLEDTFTGENYATESTGGLVGRNNEGTISNSYATGRVNGDKSVGGLVGYNFRGSVELSYSRGYVTGNAEAGGLVGKNKNGNITGSYYDTDTSGQSDKNGTGLPSLSMKNSDKYVDWDFLGVWEQNIHNSGYPYFRAYQNFLTYVSNDTIQNDEPSHSVTYIPNTSMTVDGNISKWTKVGFILNGWNTERDGSGTAYSKGDTIVSNTNILLYANWVVNDENLSGLSLSSGATLNPAFDENRFSYKSNVANSVASINVTPVAAKHTSKVTVAINGGAAELVTSGQASSELPLKVGVNTINVVVIASDGIATKTYTVSVTREYTPIVVTPSLSSNANLKQLSLTGGVQLNPEFSSDILSYTLDVDNSQALIRIIPVLMDERAAVKLVVNGTTSSSVNDEVALNVGINVIDVVVTAENGTIKRYTLAITRKQEIKVNNKCSFNDIEHHWAKAEICEAASLGIVERVSAIHFKANTAITRTEFVVMLLRTLQVEHIEESINMSFRDQDSIPEWARPAIYTALKQGIIKGYPDGTLRPLNTIKRIEMAAIIARVMNWPNSSIEFAAFSDDKSIPDWAKEYVQSAREHGILTGHTNNTFAPFGKTTRAEVAVALLRLRKIL